MSTPRDEFAKLFGEKEASKVDQLLLQRTVSAVASMIKEIIKIEGIGEHLGFTIVMFEYGPLGGSMAYASTADRADFLRLLDELRGKLAASVSDAPKGD